MRPKALFLDLDDTILSFSAGQTQLWRRVLEDHREPIEQAAPGLPLGELERVIESRVVPSYWADPERAARGRLDLYRARREVLARALRHLCRPLPEALVARVADTYTETKEREVAPLQEALEVVRALRAAGFRLALITNGSSEFQRAKLRRFDLERRFEAILIEGEWGVGKPHPSIFREALRAMSLRPAETWMVGDNFEADIGGAAAVGIAGVWLHHGRPAPAGPVAPREVVEHLRDLLPLLGVASGASPSR